MNIRKIGVMITCLMMLFGCSSQPPVVRNIPTPHIVYVLTPEALITRCHVTIPDPQVIQCLQQSSGRCLSNPAMLSLITSLYADLGRCNLDWQALEQWQSENKADLKQN
ncbi:hypothetical protein [Shewanella algae]|uniref:hypothetical protein n=1 Tax=Shewanella algae TaxID=38313 RepID=UPI003CC7A8D2